MKNQTAFKREGEELEPLDTVPEKKILLSPTPPSTETYSLSVIMTKEGLHYYSNKRLALAENLTKEQYEYCRKLHETGPEERERMYLKRLQKESPWPFPSDAYRNGNALFIVERNDSFDDCYETPILQPWFRYLRFEEDPSAVPRNNHGLIWIHLCE